MKIDSNDFGSINKILQSKGNQITKRDFIPKDALKDNGYSSLEQKELNNTIGILQIASQTLKNIIENSTISLKQIKIALENAKFLGNNVFAPQTILVDSYQHTLFDANRILNLIPNDERDLYSFKKALKEEYEFINHSLETLKTELANTNISEANDMKNYLYHNALLFSKSHDTRGLANKIDSLLM